MRAHLRRAQQAPLQELALGRLRLDALAVRASVDGRPMALSVKEFMLLRKLVAHADEVRSRPQILAEVWGSADAFEPTIVDQYVSYLRRKLDAAGGDVRIATVRGAGYRIELVP